MAKAPCSITDCGRPVTGRGFCARHYARYYSHGDPLAGGKNRAFKKGPVLTCRAALCLRTSEDGPINKGYCIMHYTRLKRWGNEHKTSRGKVRVCSVADCWRDHLGKGMCRLHYDAWRKQDNKEGAAIKARARMASERFFNKKRHSPTLRYEAGRKLAAQRNISWELTLEEFCVIIAQPCDYCGVDPSAVCTTGTWIDRKDNKASYNLSNSTPCCPKCNHFKTNLTTHEEAKALIALLRAMRAGTVWSPQQNRRPLFRGAGENVADDVSAERVVR